MRITRVVAVGLGTAALIISGSGAAFAGEVQGPPEDGFATGDWTPVAGYVMKSICAFSGLNAFHEGKDAVFPAVQSYGMGVRIGEPGPNPGESCNGHTGWIVNPPPEGGGE